MPAAAAAKAVKPAIKDKERKQHSEKREEKNEKDRGSAGKRKVNNTGGKVRKKKKEWLALRDCRPGPVWLLGGPDDQKGNNHNNNDNKTKIQVVKYIYNLISLYKITDNSFATAKPVHRPGWTGDYSLNLFSTYLSHYRLLITGDYRPLSLYFF